MIAPLWQHYSLGVFLCNDSGKGNTVLLPYDIEILTLLAGGIANPVVVGQKLSHAI